MRILKILPFLTCLKNPRAALICTTFFDKIVAVITNVLSFIGYAAILFTYSRLMLIVVVAVVVINLICNAKKNKYYYKAGEDAAPMNRKFAYLAGLMYGFDYAKEIKVGGDSPTILPTNMMII